MGKRLTGFEQAIVVSDLHAGCRMGLYPPDSKLKFDEGATFNASEFQRKVWGWWDEFWKEWTPRVTRKEPYCVIVNGDIIDNAHHNSKTPLTNNLADQRKIAMAILSPIRDLCDGRLYIVKGTTAHSGESGEDEEELASDLEAIPDENDQYARNELWIDLAGCLVHAVHTIGSTSSAAYEATAVHKELVEEYAEAAQFGERIPNVIVRSHRHRYIKTECPTKYGYGIAVTTPGWQAKTPFAFRLARGRTSSPQFGGILIRRGDEESYTRAWIKNLSRPRIEGSHNA